MWTLLLGLALAQDAISMSAVRAVQAGDGAPSVTFSPGVSGHLDVSLACGGKRYSYRGGMTRGEDRVIRLDGLGEGTHACSGKLAIRADDGTTGEMALAFDVAVLPALELAVKAEELDLEGRSLWLESARPLKSAQVQVIGEKGAVLGEETVALDGMTRTELRWTQREGEVLQLRIVGTDAHDFRGELLLSPWSYAIPHDDVVFASGKHDIVAAEEPKLESAWRDLEAVKARYGDVVEMRLYVGGYTDTVGGAASNQALSERRARAIAAWFRARGFTGPIYYQGFGEDALAVGTPDNTDEAANRRAVYIVAAQQPPLSTELPRTAWRRL